MHEISHTLGIGQTAAFNTKCAANDWATATPLLRSWDGQSAKINCGGGHIWPYGLNVSYSLHLAAHLALFTFIPGFPPPPPARFPTHVLIRSCLSEPDLEPLLVSGCIQFTSPWS